MLKKNRASLRAQPVKSMPAVQETGFSSWVGKIPWRRKWQPTPVFLPGESHGQRSLAGYSPQESDTFIFMLKLKKRWYQLFSFILILAVCDRKSESMWDVNDQPV